MLATDKGLSVLSDTDKLVLWRHAQSYLPNLHGPTRLPGMYYTVQVHIVHNCTYLYAANASHVLESCCLGGSFGAFGTYCVIRRYLCIAYARGYMAFITDPCAENNGGGVNTYICNP